MATRKPRLYVTMSDEVMEYIQSKAEKSGATLSAVAGMMLLDYIEQQKALGTFEELVKYMQRRKDEAEQADQAKK